MCIRDRHKWAPGDSAANVGNIIDDHHALGWKVLISVTGKTPYPAANLSLIHI